MVGKYLALFGLALIAITGSWAAEEDVFEWGDGDFAEELRRHDNTLVMFYAPW